MSVGVRQHVEDGLDRASRLVLTEALPRPAAAGVGFRGVKLDTVGVYWVDVLRQRVQRLGDPGGLCLEHGHAAEDEVLFVDVPDRARIVEVEQMHRVGYWWAVKKVQPGERKAQRTAGAALPTAIRL